SPRRCSSARASWCSAQARRAWRTISRSSCRTRGPSTCARTRRSARIRGGSTSCWAWNELSGAVRKAGDEPLEEQPDPILGRALEGAQPAGDGAFELAKLAAHARFRVERPEVLVPG